MCLRLRRAGWRIHRLPDEMALHDIAMTRASQWWRRARRGGWAYAAAHGVHGHPNHYTGRLRRVILWGMILPLVTVAGAIATPWALVLLLAWPAQVLRLRLKGYPFEQAIALTIGKLAEAQGVIDWWRGPRAQKTSKRGMTASR